MSVKVAGLCYDVTFGCPKRKAVAIALADHADHDGNNVFPSVSRIAKKVEWGERTVQRVLRELEALGILVVVSEGGSGPKDTREWKFDMQLLADLAEGFAEITSDKGDYETPIKGDCQSPLEGLRVTRLKLRVSGTTDKGVYVDTRTVINHQELSAREGARATESAARPRRVMPAIRIKASDIQWQDWLTYIGARDSDLRDRVAAAGEITVASRWPKADESWPEGPPLPRIEKIRDPTGAG